MRAPSTSLWSLVASWHATAPLSWVRLETPGLSSFLTGIASKHRGRATQQPNQDDRGTTITTTTTYPHRHLADANHANQAMLDPPRTRGSSVSVSSTHAHAHAAPSYLRPRILASRSQSQIAMGLLLAVLSGLEGLTQNQCEARVSETFVAIHRPPAPPGSAARHAFPRP